MSNFEPVNTVHTISDVAKKIEAARNFLISQKLGLHRDCSIARIFREAASFCKEWHPHNLGKSGVNRMIAMGYALRIADSVLELSNDSSSTELLRRIAGNPIDLSARSGHSQAKDALWELELLTLFRRCGINARSAEPDILLNIEGDNYALACKKVYSVRGIEAQVRKGTKQISKSGYPGLVALNIDELVPADSILECVTLASGMEHLAIFVRNFVNAQRQSLERFIQEGRCDGIMFTVSCPLGTENSLPRFLNARSSLIWHDTGANTVCDRITRLRRYMPPALLS